MIRTSSIFMQFGRDPPLHDGVRNKSWKFLFFFVCHALDLELGAWRPRGLVIQIAILSPFVSQFWCAFQHSSEKEMLFQILKRHLNFAARWRYIYLRIRSKFEFFWKLLSAVQKAGENGHFVRTISLTCYTRSSSRDETANVNFFTTTSYTHYKITTFTVQ